MKDFTGDLEGKVALVTGRLARESGAPSRLPWQGQERMSLSISGHGNWKLTRLWVLLANCTGAR
jgi:hypothetical protein